MRKIWLAAAALALPVFAAVPLPRAPERYVTDAANVIDETREFALNERLAQFARETSNQVIVYVDRERPPGSASIEELGAEAIRTWRVGDAQKDNGAILFLFIDSRESRIEVGYGLEEKLTDALSKRILVGLRPDLRVGDYATAAETGASEIIAAITGKPAAVTAPAPVRQHVAPVAAAEPKVDSNLLVFLLTFFAIIGVFVIVAFVKHSGIDWSWTHSSSNDWTPSSSNDSSSSWSSNDSSSSSSSSGSDFSGGGGSGGGGGASDNW
jgi:uncharacterized protein